MEVGYAPIILNP